MILLKSPLLSSPLKHLTIREWKTCDLILLGIIGSNDVKHEWELQ